VNKGGSAIGAAPASGQLAVAAVSGAISDLPARRNDIFTNLFYF
jgi:hypothetical protein